MPPDVREWLPEDHFACLDSGFEPWSKRAISALLPIDGEIEPSVSP
jgi:hypothetical protein